MVEDDHTNEFASTDSSVEPAAGAVGDTSIGMRLAAIREYKNLTLDDVAAHTQISKEKLANIETMNFDKPSVFLRGAVKSYAAMLGLPADQYAKEYIEAIEGLTASAVETKTVISEAPVLPTAQINRFAPQKQKRSIQVTAPMMGGAIAAVCAVGVIIWGLTGTTPPEPTVSKSVLAITVPQNGGDQSLLAEASASFDNSYEALDLSVTALRTAWIEVRGADGTIFRSRRMGAGESYHPRLGSGWTITARDGSAFEWRVGDVSVGKLSEERTEVFAASVDQAARQAAEILAPPVMAGSNETQSSR